MIKFFKRIRKQLADDNKPLKYARYAIGEIVLVVIGILIALSINNWNEERIEQINEQELFSNIIEDLSEDYQTLSNLLIKVKEKQQIHLHLYNESVAKIDPDKEIPYGKILATTDVISITWDNHKGSIEKISDRGIRSGLNQYFRYHRIVLTASENLNENIVNYLRPYLKLKAIINLEAVFESNPNRDDKDRSELFHLDLLSEEFGTKEFDSNILTLFLATQDVIQSLEAVLEKNELLRAELENRQR